MTLELTPPETLTPPEAVAPVPQDQADGLVRLESPTIERLDEKVTEFVEVVVGSPAHSKPFEDRITAIHNLGNKEIRASAGVSNRMLERPVKAMEGNLFDERSPVSRSLLDLRRTVEDLDPARQGDLFSPRKLLGLIPFGDRLRDYFMRYQSAQSHINAILNTLYQSQDELRKDNAVIEQEKVNMWQLMQQLQQYVYVGKQIDAALEVRIAEMEVRDPEKARIVKEEMLFYVRQKVQDLLTQLAVNIQGYLALDMIRKNNLELIKGVDRATTTTVSALRTAVMVAQALANQKLVLDQITALRTTTSNLIESTSVLLKRQTADIHEQATSAAVNMEQLQAAFNNIYQTMDMIADFKIEALGAMRQTVDALSSEVEKAQSYLDRMRSEELASATGDLNLLAGAQVNDGVVDF
ncbi:MAG: toxic anion resistance protein [Chloroflexota bacterium]